MGGEIKKEAFDLSSLKSKIDSISKDHGQHCSHAEGEECKDYLLEYPMKQRRCIAALERLDQARSCIEAEFRAEVQELEKKYMSKYAPIYADRASLVSGARDPLPEEYGEVPEDPVQELDSSGQAIAAGAEKGVPKFWLTVLKNHPAFSEMIAEDDEAALATLEDIRVGTLSNGAPGFRLEFVFGENDFFSNRALVKEYHLAPPSHPLAPDYIYDHATGTEIDWKDGKNLCFRTVTKTQRQKNGKGTRVVRREEPQESFFHFFQPPTLDDESDDEEDVEALEQELEADYEAGDLIKSEIVPNAIHWFTGKALEYADYNDYFDEEDEEDEDDSDEGSEESEEDSEDESDEDAKETSRRNNRPQHRQPSNRATHGNQEQQQCKQQ